jgi:hypothetical protein
VITFVQLIFNAVNGGKTKTANEFCISHSLRFPDAKRYGVICSAFFFAAS